MVMAFFSMVMVSLFFLTTWQEQHIACRLDGFYLFLIQGI